jgi:hypothetical protein
MKQLRARWQRCGRKRGLKASPNTHRSNPCHTSTNKVWSYFPPLMNEAMLRCLRLSVSVGARRK